MRTILILISLLLSVARVVAQPSDSSPIDPAASGRLSRPPADPVANRLFLMPTGRLIDRGRFYVGNVGLLALTAGYAPSSLMQINAGVFYSPSDNFPSYGTAGIKVRALEPEGWFGGLALGADFGFLYTGTGFHYRGALQQYSIATSAGTSAIEGHLAASAFPYKTYDNGRLDVRFMVQTGVTVPLDIGSDERGMKIMAEFWAGGRSLNTTRTIYAAAGIRNYGWTFTWELGIATGPRCYGDCDNNDLEIYPFPFAGVTIFL